MNLITIYFFLVSYFSKSEKIFKSRDFSLDQCLTFLQVHSYYSGKKTQSSLYLSSDLVSWGVLSFTLKLQVSGKSQDKDVLLDTIFYPSIANSDSFCLQFSHKGDPHFFRFFVFFF